MSIEIVLFDLGRVVLDWEPDRLYRKLIPDPQARARFLNEVCTMAWHTRHDAGTSFADNADALINKHPQHAPLIRAWGERWMEMFDGYIDGTPDLMDRLAARGHDLYALTNMPSETWPLMVTHFPRMEMFVDVIVSGDENCIKPDRKIYDIALRRMGSPAPETVLFIDDSAANIEAAAARGFITHHFKSVSSLETALIGHKLISQSGSDQ